MVEKFNCPDPTDMLKYCLVGQVHPPLKGTQPTRFLYRMRFHLREESIPMHVPQPDTVRISGVVTLAYDSHARTYHNICTPISRWRTTGAAP